MNWLKKHWGHILLIILVVLLMGTIMFLMAEFKEYIKDYSENSARKYECLDYSNKGGVARIRSSFTDILINSEGSRKKGEGYEVFTSIVNPSSINLKSSMIIYSWRHNGLNQATTVANPNDVVYPGSSIKKTAFLSPLEGDELKNIWVQADFEIMQRR